MADSSTDRHLIYYLFSFIEIFCYIKIIFLLEIYRINELSSVEIRIEMLHKCKLFSWLIFENVIFENGLKLTRFSSKHVFRFGSSLSRFSSAIKVNTCSARDEVWLDKLDTSFCNWNFCIDRCSWLLVNMISFHLIN